MTHRYNVSNLDEEKISKGEKIGNRVLVERDSAEKKKRKRTSQGGGGKGGKKAHK